MRKRIGSARAALVMVGVVALLALPGCGGDEDADEPPGGGGADTTSAPTDAADDGAGGETDDGTDAGGSGTATITFADGETLSTEVLCALEPQEATGGGQILYSATSLDSPYFDLTVFGEGGEPTEAGVSWDETEDFQTYLESWSAGGFGSDLEVGRDDTTITASGTFTRGADESGQEGKTRQGEVVVECG